MSNSVRTFDNHFWWYLIIAILFIIGICFLPYLLTSTRVSLIDFTESGQIGDTIGGIMGPFIAIIASLLTFLAFWVQYKANLQQRRDISIERFENKFFQLLQMQENIINGLYYTPSDGADRNYGTTFHGRHIFQVLYEQKGWGSEWGIKSKIQINGYNAYSSDKDIIVLDHYFRHLYHIFKFIDDNKIFNLEEKYQYSKIARATLSPYELVMLFYNCLSQNGKSKFKPLIETFAIFNNLRIDLLEENRDQKLYINRFDIDFNSSHNPNTYEKGAFVFNPS